MIHLSTSLKYYKRLEIQEAIIAHSGDKEVAARFNDKFGKRPDVLQYPNDVLDMAKNGATSFHCSEELWSNPLQLRPLMNRKELDALRIGWDLVLDIDCKFIEYSKKAANLIMEALKHHNITSLSIKFSGNKGFHIAIPFQSFPREINGADVKLLFPEAAKRVALYIKEKITPSLGKQILEMEGGSFNNVATKTGIEVNKLYLKDENKVSLNPEPFLAIDTLLISSRHMYRVPYSLHEKSGLASIPIEEDEILNFNLDQAKPENVVVTKTFLDRSQAKPQEAAKLFTDAFDATVKQVVDKEEKEYEIPAEAVPEGFFPPCIKKLFLGVEDGRKRTLFILTNFLSSCGWSYEAIETRLRDWNKKNREPLHETYFLGQLRYHKQHRKKILPPNCHNAAYYTDLRVKCPEEICSKFKNPVGYARRKSNK